MKIDKNFYKKNSIIDVRNLIDKKIVKTSDLIQFSLDQIKQKKNYNFLTNSSFKIFDNKSFFDSYNFKSNKLLNSIPFFAKDIFNTIDFNTEMGSKIWKNFKAGNNARVIDNLLSEGSILMGKSTTAEFAVHYETKCINAINSNRIPGTSSTGSAVGVALGIVPYALGTQTAGSITRPASYNGVFGIKPTFGMIPRTGILKTCDSLDTVGFLTSNFYNIKILLDVMRVKGKNYPFIHENIDLEKKIKPEKMKLGFIKTYTWENLENYNLESFIGYINQIKTQFNIEEINVDKQINDIHNLHKKIYYKSLAYYFKREKKLGIKLSSIIKKIIIKGEKISNNEFIESIQKQNYLIDKFDQLMENFDMIIAPGTAGVAPKKLDMEKDDSSLIWTFLHVPSIFAPLFKGPSKLPFGVQYIGKKWNDFIILNVLENFKKYNLID